MPSVPPDHFDKEEDKAKSVSFDGRLSFYAVMEKVMLRQVDAAFTGDIKIFERSLVQLLSMVRNFIKKSQYEDLMNRLNKARNNARLSPESAYRALERINADVYKHASHVMVPQRDSEDDEDFFENFEEEFIKRSDL